MVTTTRWHNVVGRAMMFIMCLLMNGCILLYSYRPLDVSTRDAETEVPVPHARIEVDYPYMMLLNIPRSVTTKTDAMGLAVVRTASVRSQVWHVSAPGYIYGQYWGADLVPNARHLDFRLYSKPEPEVTFVLPAGFRGPLKVKMQPASKWVQDSPGKRQFTYAVSGAGYVLIDATPLLLHFAHFKAKFEDAETLPEFYGDGDVALRWIEQSNHRYLFVVGTRDEAQAAYPLFSDFKDGDLHTTFFNERKFNKLFEGLAYP